MDRAGWPHNFIDQVGIEPYYHDELGIIYCGDCLEIMPKMPDECVDLVCMDPPYNVGIDYGGYKDKLPAKIYLTYISSLITRAKKLSNKLVIVLGSKVVREWWNCIPDAKLIIVKMGAISNNKIKGLTLQYHPILTTAKSNTWMIDLWEDIRWPGEGYFFNEPRYGHPAMTPLKLMQRCIKIFSNGSNKIVFDPFLGSGTTAVAAIKLDRRYIGIEINEDYCKIAKERIEREKEQLGLWTPTWMARLT